MLQYTTAFFPQNNTNVLRDDFLLTNQHNESKLPWSGDSCARLNHTLFISSCGECLRKIRPFSCDTKRWAFGVGKVAISCIPVSRASARPPATESSNSIPPQLCVCPRISERECLNKHLWTCWNATGWEEYRATVAWCLNTNGEHTVVLGRLGCAQVRLRLCHPDNLQWGVASDKKDSVQYSMRTWPLKWKLSSQYCNNTARLRVELIN